MYRTPWYFLIAALTLLAAADLHAGDAKRKPNIVFFLVDDLGWTDLGCQGSKFYETPNIDKLAKSGMRFTNGYAACPVCSPTRASIMTGKYPARLHITNWFSGMNKGKLLPAPYEQQLPLGEFTLAEALREAGYATGFFGKWHLGGEGFEPTRQGFDVNLGGNHRGSPPSYFSPYKNPQLPDGPRGEHLADRLATEAISFIEKNKDRPFLVYMSFYSVHTPLQAKQELVAKYKAKAEKNPIGTPTFLPEHDKKARQVQDHPVYSGMIESMDTNVGRILSKLEELGLDDNTIIIFTSDNGGLATAEGWPTSNLPLRAGKGWLYEGGTRVAYMIRWPGHTRPGSTCDVPVISNDFYPTLLEMARLAARPKQHMDGVSLVPLLKESGKFPDRPLFWHYPHYSNQGGRPSASIRQGDFVLIENYEDNSLELYNLKDDLGQKVNLAKKMPDQAALMLKRLHNWQQEVDALMPTPNPEWKGKE
jgi:arylsulfatase A-like enzyme